MTDVKSFLENATHHYLLPTMLNVIKLCSEKRFSRAKCMWAREICEFDLNEPILPGRKPGDLHGSEFQHALFYAGLFFQTKCTFSCKSRSCAGFGNSLFYKETDANLGYQPGFITDLNCFSPEEFIKLLNESTDYPAPCPCGAGRTRNLELVEENPPFLFFTLVHGQESTSEEDVPRRFDIKGTLYHLFAYTTKIGDTPGAHHFVVTFAVDGKKILYDGMKPTHRLEHNTNNMVTSIWVVRADQLGFQ